MDDQSLINILGGIIAVLIGWFIRILWEGQTQLSKRIDETSSLLPDTYLRRDDYREDIADIKKMLSKIFDRLEMKADK
jgi:hypothetical protein